MALTLYEGVTFTCLTFDGDHPLQCLWLCSHSASSNVKMFSRFRLWCSHILSWLAQTDADGGQLKESNGRQVSEDF